TAVNRGSGEEGGSSPAVAGYRESGAGTSVVESGGEYGGAAGSASPAGSSTVGKSSSNSASLALSTSSGGRSGTPSLRISSTKLASTRAASWQPRLYHSRCTRTSARGSAGENGMRRKRSQRPWSAGQIRCITV